MSREQAQSILKTIEGRGYRAYLVGGCVRDLLLGREPEDWDIASAARPEQIMEIFGAAAFPTGLKHGTVTVKAADGAYEITTFRTDGSYSDGRHPDAVKFAKTIDEDLARRDLTINAMALDSAGNIVDPFDGAGDLKRRVVRCVGDARERFREDALRILRALRFSAKLGFTLDPATEAAALAARDTLHTVSAERLYTELDGLLLAPGAGQTLAQYGEILSGAVPEILPCIGCTQPGKWHCYDVWQHSAAAVGALDLRGQDTRGVRVLCWATFLHDIAKPLCRSVGPDGAAHFKGHNQRGAQLARVILRRLKAPAYLVDGAVGLIAVHDAPLPADDVGILKLLNRSGAIFLRRLCALKYADLDAHANTPEVAARRADVAAFERRMNELAKTGCYTMRQLAVNGADLMDIGIPAGPGVGATLQTLLNDVMEGTLPNEREALLAAAVK